MTVSSACHDLIHFAMFQGFLVGFVLIMGLVGYFYIRKKL